MDMLGTYMYICTCGGMQVGLFSHGLVGRAGPHDKEGCGIKLH